MTPKARKAYHGYLWPEACLANEWDVKDEDRRRAVTLECMQQIRASEVTDRTSDLGEAEITALFVYLRHLADPSSLEKSADWVSCQDDYKTFALARNADWHERELYGTGKNKLDKNRFKGRTTAAGGALETLDPLEVKKRHLTFATRHQAKQRAEKISRPKGEAQYAPDTTKPAETHTRSVEPMPSGSTLTEGLPF